MADRDGLAAFLRSRRARLTPAGAGLAAAGRRRVPGLRREEVAQLAGISVEYYQRLEQGRAAHPSPEVLDALVTALRLDDVERGHLRVLAVRNRRPHPEQAIPEKSDLKGAVPEHTGPNSAVPGDAGPISAARGSAGPDKAAPGKTGPKKAGLAGKAGPPSNTVRPDLQRMLDLIHTPALVIDDRFDVLAANAVAARLFLLAPSTDGERPNLAAQLFLDPGSRNFYVDWDEVTAATAGQLRVTAGLHPGDRRLSRLIRRLHEGSETFRLLWGARDVSARTRGLKSFRHPALGTVTFSYEHFVPAADSRQRLVVLVPVEGSATEAAVQLLTTWAGPAHTPGSDLSP
ncbi:helix-turn-helix domain-containing protein [Nonomuraea sp. NN258]|uniref:helix-turn-helix transcriptional regulator n=1 Tax=Nonomuraea antri TaxID=2730852 RepID=UPI0015681044|nr:helix-turn-helix domain-containing protein [Nonomuraea antri]NRQ40497.1 helix-turn-helix domain-containing protein [Nonomuraea antri]